CAKGGSSSLYWHFDFW
nr:immunoglobulin heavy chain junction region [Macaca mulatta]MOW23774.1 immunoglobulin heavy chain junction region [Macaca mulatta]MOW23874.1 immunoglobulin heavy chain junction region [Macaca mulatta]MOW23896.1 immunoglobulin heavy chain junction region [Macaca mulatta]MOW24359.1 immunoglobulin heavy chain junction region [Macaca mulatta]